jgi:hypothetical protein
MFLRLTTLEPEEGDSSFSETMTVFVAITTRVAELFPLVLSRVSGIVTACWNLRTAQRTDMKFCMQKLRYTL